MLQKQYKGITKFFTASIFHKKNSYFFLFYTFNFLIRSDSSKK